jgi:lipid-A-disaccharide synthase
MSTSAPVIWINTAEPSGDMHGALLAEALLRLRPEARIEGMGGPQLHAAGQLEQTARIEELSVMGFTEVFSRLPRVFGLLREIRQAMARRSPDLVVCIDAPDFNFRVIRIARRLGVPVVYYISPKLWAWRRGRAEFIQRHVARMLCILPFEVDFYAGYGVQAEYVGNPLLDAIDWEEVDGIRREAARIAILPGSRRKEIESLLPAFGEAARIMLASRPSLRFCLARAHSVSEERVRQIWPSDVPLDIQPPERRHAVMRSSRLALAASGTVTLETALLGTPTIVAYRLSRLTFALAKRVVRVPYISLPNLILGEAVFPEHLQEQAEPRALAERALEWLESPAILEDIQARLQRLRTLLGEPGAPQRAAESILRLLDQGD